MTRQSIQTIRQNYYMPVLGLLLAIKLIISPSFMEIQYRPSAAYGLNIIGTILVLYSAWFLFRQNRHRFIYAFSVYALSSLLIVTQIVYIRYFTRPVSLYALLQLANLQGLGNSIWSLMSFSDLVMLFDVPFILLFLLPGNKKQIIERKKALSSMAFSLGMILMLIVPAHMKFVQNKPLLYPWREWENLIHYNIVEYQFIDFFITVTSRTRLSLNTQDQDQIKHWLEDNKKYNSFQYRDELFGIGKKKNIIVIQCEALGNFVINRKHNNGELTPNVNRLIKESMYFSHHHCQNFHGGTSDAELILLTSLFPLMKGSTFFRYPGNYYTALPTLLKEEGYTTAAFHGNQKSFWNRGESYPSLGIDEFYDAEKMFGKKEWINDDGKVFDKSISILKSLEKPFFSIIITIETHLGSDLLDINGYFEAIHKLDASLGKFIADLKQNGLYNDSIIILYGDHIPYLKYGEIVRRDSSLAWIQKPGREVPFVIHIPGVAPAVISRITAHVDAYPAIAYIMGIDPGKYAGHIMGKNMITTKESYALTYPDEYLSDDARVSPKELAHRKTAFDIGDLIIRSNYFSEYINKVAASTSSREDKARM